MHAQLYLQKKPRIIMSQFPYLHQGPENDDINNNLQNTCDANKVLTITFYWLTR